MRRLTEPQAHRARVAMLEGKFPEGMQSRCAWCRQVRPVSEGSFITTKVQGTGHMQVFRCASCTPDASEESAA